MNYRVLNAACALLTVAAIVVAVILAMALSPVLSSADAMGEKKPASTCQEDDPCWNWVTMGNRKRGVVTLWGTPKVVGPCEFRALWMAGSLRYHVTVDGTTYRTLDRMKGDSFALYRAHCPNTPSPLDY